MTTPRQQYDLAREQGAQARRNGKKATDNPYRIGTIRVQYEAWLGGFQDQAASLRGRR